ncbi:hypothetical protein PBAL39_23978 [Pedobacter sp. BAL39]|uniref:lipocalin family protein n=1 Tax=Pedobacter sp. BAL39 TaxID=391596 RepID=UPI000155B054|nr:lipocalin family protein [Pedobacter sp. BAL39]EDM34595.1 hypothetical protein PBAL39_23978 [Pedobacter sp. BAL39]
MKQQITFALTLFLMIAGFSSCKKEDQNSNKSKLTGTWKVSRIETMAPGTETTNYTGVSSDSFEFRSNDEDEVVANLKSTSSVGNYTVLEGTGLNMTIFGKVIVGDISTITDTDLVYRGTVQGSSPVITETYYFTR